METTTMESSNQDRHKCSANTSRNSLIIFKNRIIDKLLMSPFRVLATTLLSLLLPLSYLLLARLATANYLLSVAAYNNIYLINIFKVSWFSRSFFFYTNHPTLVHLLVLLISTSSLTSLLTGEIAFFNYENHPLLQLTRRRVYLSWALLIIVQLCLGIGIEGSIVVGISGSGFGQERRIFSRIMFFLGLHEATLFWRRTVVKPVVDDTMLGGNYTNGGLFRAARESWAEKAVMGLSCGGLWWWRLREEVEALVLVPQVKRELMMSIGLCDFAGWWLYYLTVTIGMVRVLKAVVLTEMIMTRCYCRSGDRLVEDFQSNDEKV